MFSNLSSPPQESATHYPILDKNLPFSDYILQCRALIENRRVDLHKAGINAKQVIDANMPFELRPSNATVSNNKVKTGALLIHGLFDCPFSLRDIGFNLQKQGILTRSILLPGHGTVPSDLLHVTYHDWLNAVRYGIESLKQEVDQVYLVGYSMGAALSLYHAIQDPQIAKVILLAPAIKIKAPVDIVVNWHRLLTKIGKNKQWIYLDDENDYAKYQSIAFNPVTQINQLINVVSDLRREHALTCPVFMAMSYEDETVSSRAALDFFTELPNPESTFLLFSEDQQHFPDARVINRCVQNAELGINHLSHISTIFSPNNVHYGVNGDYAHASHTEKHEFIYGAYNHIEVNVFDLLYNLGVTNKRRRELSYNPDFGLMMDAITKFASA